MELSCTCNLLYFMIIVHLFSSLIASTWEVGCIMYLLACLFYRSTRIVCLNFYCKSIGAMHVQSASAMHLQSAINFGRIFLVYRPVGRNSYAPACYFYSLYCSCCLFATSIWQFFQAYVVPMTRR